jgi:hypothetical protein
LGKVSGWGYIVYVFFPKHKIGCSPKFTFVWRGPFIVQRIITDVGREARLEIIHCDRMRKKPSQELYHESTDLSGTAVEEGVPPSIMVSDRTENVDGTCSEHSKRRVKRPVRFDVFVV